MRKINYEKLAAHIEKWIKQYIENANAKGVVVSLSGGIDSATTAALCANSLGNDKVFSVNLPCESISEDFEDAQLIADVLDLEFQKFDLTPTYKEFLNVMPPKMKESKIAMANLKPRLRMMVNYFIAQSKGDYLVAGTSN